MMILTDKAREDFFKWKSSNKDLSTIEIIDFRYLSKISRNAFIIDFFDSMGIYINVQNINKGVWFEYSIDNDYKNTIEFSENKCNSRQEATKKAIIKANEIYNKKHK